MEFIQAAPHVQPPRPNVATIGFFDGVHLGHRFLIEQVKRVAAERALASLLVTFPIHPRKVMQTEFQPQLLSTFEEKCRLLADTGADYCGVLPFTPTLSSLTAREFMQEILYGQLNVRTLVVGYDHRFGHNRSEGFEDYRRYGEELGMEVLPAEAFSVGEVHVSSSVIRLFLKEGEVAMAARCLGYNYFIEGHVTGGHQIGRTLGYPTANLHVDNENKLIPADGVYAARVYIEGKAHGAMLNIGFRPTIGSGPERSIEAHILHFTGDLYRTPLRIEFVSRIRGEQKFHNREELVARLQQDAIEAERILG